MPHSQHAPQKTKKARKCPEISHKTSKHLKTPENTPKYVPQDYRGIGGRAHLPPKPESLTKARAHVSLEMADIKLHKNKVGGYAYNDAQICVTQIIRVLERQTFEDLLDGMKGLASETPNELTNMKSTVSIMRKHILQEFKKSGR